MSELARPPELVACFPLEGQPRVYFHCDSEGDEFRLRDYIGANVETILARTRSALEQVAGSGDKADDEIDADLEPRGGSP